MSGWCGGCFTENTKPISDKLPTILLTLFPPRCALVLCRRFSHCPLIPVSNILANTQLYRNAGAHPRSVVSLDSPPIDALNHSYRCSSFDASITSAAKEHPGGGTGQRSSRKADQSLFVMEFTNYGHNQNWWLTFGKFPKNTIYQITLNNKTFSEPHSNSQCVSTFFGCVARSFVANRFRNNGREMYKCPFEVTFISLFFFSSMEYKRQNLIYFVNNYQLRADPQN